MRSSSSLSWTSRAKACMWRTSALMISRKRALGARASSLKTAVVTSSCFSMITGSVPAKVAGDRLDILDQVNVLSRALPCRRIVHAPQGLPPPNGDQQRDHDAEASVKAGGDVKTLEVDQGAATQQPHGQPVNRQHAHAHDAAAKPLPGNAQ